MTEQKPIEIQTFDTFSIKFYRNKRIFRSFICSFAIAYLTESPFWFVFAHVMATIFWEGWFFNYWKVKESSVIPEWYLEMQGVSREQVDQYVEFAKNLRRITAGLSCTAVFFYYFFLSKKTVDITVCFLGTYTIMTVVALIIAERMKRIKHFYPNFINLGSQPATKIVSTSGENTWSTASCSAQDRLSLLNPQNPMGYNNLMSPNYIGKSMFDN